MGAQNRREEVRREDKQSFGRGASREKREEERRRAVEEDREVDKRGQAIIHRKMRVPWPPQSSEFTEARKTQRCSAKKKSSRGHVKQFQNRRFG